MTNSKNIFLAKLCFVLTLIGVLIFFASLKPRIMVVHSLSKKEKWTEDFNKGFQRLFSKGNHTTVSYQYLDAKSDLSALYELKTGVLARQTINRFDPDLLVLCDRYAQELIGRAYINRPDKNIIFCRLNSASQDPEYDEARNVTSVFEHIPTEAIKELIPFLAHKNEAAGAIKIILLGDNSDVSKVLKQAFALADWRPYALIDLVTANTFEEWKNAVSSITNRADILLVSNYKKIYADNAQTTLKDPRELIRWTLENTSIPVVGSVDAFVQDGGEIALTPSPLGQGESAAIVAQRLLHGENAKDIPPLNNQDYLVYLNDKISNAKRATLPSIYQAFARAMNNGAKDE